LQIADDTSAPVSLSSSSQQVLPSHQLNMKQVSVEEIFEVRHSGFDLHFENLLFLRA
jgi:hypothetical protein